MTEACILRPPVYTRRVQGGANLEACLALTPLSLFWELNLFSLIPNLMSTFCELTGSGGETCLYCMYVFEGYRLCYLLLHNHFKMYCFPSFRGLAGWFYWSCQATFRQHYNQCWGILDGSIHVSGASAGVTGVSCHPPCGLSLSPFGLLSWKRPK